MRRSAIFKCSKQEAKLMLLLMLIHSQCSKHFFLQLFLIDPYGATANFISIQYHIISIGLDIGIRMCEVFGSIFNYRVIADHGFDLVGLWRSKRMMTGHPAISFFIVFK